MNKTTIVMALAAASLAPAAMAETRIFNWNRGDTTNSDNGGILRKVTNTYNTATDQFTFTARFDNAVTNGFWLAVSPGPNPKGHSGELALIYFDAENIAAPRATVYAYNGLNGDNSFQDGTSRPGVQTPDFIGALTNGIAGTQMSVTNLAGGGRELSLSFDATFVQNHIPLDPTDRARNEWTGVSFGNRYGIWFHPVRGLDAAYNAQGRLTQWSYQNQGWLDLDGRNTIPTPGAAAALGLGMLAAGRRRRVK
jgi:MYXO-CTERM domain-containing protein